MAVCRGESLRTGTRTVRHSGEIACLKKSLPNLAENSKFAADALVFYTYDTRAAILLVLLLLSIILSTQKKKSELRARMEENNNNKENTSRPDGHFNTS